MTDADMAIKNGPEYEKLLKEKFHQDLMISRFFAKELGFKLLIESWV